MDHLSLLLICRTFTCVTAAGSLSLEISMIPVNYDTGEQLWWGMQGRVRAATQCQQNSTFFNGQA